MLRAPILVLLLAVALAACSREADRVPPPDPMPADSASVAVDTLAAEPPVGTDTVASLPADPAKAQALDAALDTLDAFVQVLETIEGPIAAWNGAAEAARLLRYLEANQEAFVLDESPEDAARRYPQQVARLQRLEARRAAELERIGEDPAALRMLVQEMAEANAAQ